MFIDTNANTNRAPAERNDRDKGYFKSASWRSAGAKELFESQSSINVASLRDEGVSQIVSRRKERSLEGVSCRLIAQLVVVLLGAVALKWYYSTASVNELRWILAPTAALVEFISGTHFEFESFAGYMSSDHTFLIAASCAGVNFLITSFLMLSLRQLWRKRTKKIAWRFFAITAVLAYLATLVANTVRISSSLLMPGTPLEIGLSPNQLHRFEGIFIYFGFLLLLYLLSERVSGSVSEAPSLADGYSGARGLVRQSFFPLLVYYATTLGIPLANGAYRQGVDFLEHTVFVLVTPLIVMLPVIAFQLISQVRKGACPRSFFEHHSSAD